MSKLVSSPVFVGRAAELALLSEAWERADAGEAGVVLLGGEAGVGKTRLTQETSGRVASRGGLVLCGGCIEMGGEGLPLAPVVEALRRLVRQVGVDEIDRLVGGRRAELARLMPELAEPPAGMAGAADVTGLPPDIGRLFDLVLSLLERLSETRPVLLVVEDLHWADRSTRDLVGFLARAMRPARVLLLVTYRSDELHRGHPLRAFLGELERLRTVERHELERFVRSEVAEQIAAILDDEPTPELVETVHRRSEGNAFFVEELVEAARTGCLDGLSPTLRDILVARVETLPPPTQDVLRVAAAGGRRIGHRLLAAVAGLPEPELWHAVRPAIASNVLFVDAEDDHYVFRHALVREALHDEALPGEHADLHRRFAEAVEADPELSGGGVRASAALAYHWASAHDLPRALPAHIAAARAARDSYAYAEAHQHLERALEIWDRVPDAEILTGMDHLAVLEQAVDTARAAGELHRALKLVVAAREEVVALGDATRVAGVLVGHSWLLRNLAIADGIAELEAAVQLVPADPPTALRATLLAELGQALTLAPRPGPARAVTQEALELARRIGNRWAEARALLTLGCGHDGPDLVAPELVADARRLARELGDDHLVVKTYVSESDAALAAGRWDEAVAIGLEGSRLAARIGLGRDSGTVAAGNAVEGLLRAGRWPEAEALGTEISERAPVGVHALFHTVLAGELAMARGRFEAAQRALTYVNDTLARRFVGAQYTLPVAQFGAELDIWLGEPEGVPDRALAALSRYEIADVSRYATPLLATAMRAAADAASRARALRDRGGVDAALDASNRLAELAGRVPVAHSGVVNAWLVILTAELTRADGRSSPAAWSAAATTADESGQPYLRAYVGYRQAEALLGAGDREAAAKAARCAHDTATGLGARPLEREIEALARRGRLVLRPGPGAAPAGAAFAPGAVAGDGPGAGAGAAGTVADGLGLTPREVEVLRHLAEGRTNPQIAAELFISAKTASTHVSNILGKLGVTTRGEAAAVAHQLRLFDREVSDALA